MDGYPWPEAEHIEDKWWGRYPYLVFLFLGLFMIAFWAMVIGVTAWVVSR